MHAEPLTAIAGFATLLREHALRVGVAEQQAFVQAGLAVPLARSARLDAAWRATACRDARDSLADSPPKRDTAARALDTALQPPADSATGDTPAAATPRAQGGASRTDALHDRSLAEWLAQDLSQLERLAKRIARRLRARLMRRWCPNPRVFILVDVSRRMETHAQLFLRIARAFVAALDAPVFVFHTRLAEVTPLLQRDSAAVREKVNAVTAGFGGGTRIATSLADFHGVHARATHAQHAGLGAVRRFRCRPARGPGAGTGRRAPARRARDLVPPQPAATGLGCAQPAVLRTVRQALADNRARVIPFAPAAPAVDAAVGPFAAARAPPTVAAAPVAPKSCCGG